MTLLFSYGSNNPIQLGERIGRPVVGAAAFLPNYGRVFRGWSKKWGGGVASIEPDTNRNVYGYVERVTEEELKILDKFEGVALGFYRREKVRVLVKNGKNFTPKYAIAYICNKADFNAPSQKYLDAIILTINSFWLEDGHPITTKDIPLARRNPEPCSRCGGLRYRFREISPGNINCEGCHGSGKVAFAVCGTCRTGNEPVSSGKCRRCSGKGCQLCKQTGICQECQGYGKPRCQIQSGAQYEIERWGSVSSSFGYGVGRRLKVCPGVSCPLCQGINFNLNNVCSSCEGTGSATEPCYSCESKGQQPTAEERAEADRKRQVACRNQMLANMATYGLQEFLVDLVAIRIDYSPSVLEQLSGEIPTLPEYYGDILCVESIPITQAIIQGLDLVRADLQNRKIPSKFYALAARVGIDGCEIGRVADGHFVYTAGSVKDLLMWYAISTVWNHFEVQADFDVYEEQVKNQVLHGEDSLNAWFSVLKSFRLTKDVGRQHEPILNDVRALAYRQFKGINVEPFNFGY